MIDFHYADGRPVSFAPHMVIHAEPHLSGSGTAVTLGPSERPREMHLRESYEKVMAEIRMTDIERAMRDFIAREERAE